MHPLLFITSLVAGIVYAQGQQCAPVTPICGITQIEPQGARFHCGQRGKINQVALLQPACLSTFQDCRDSCIRNVKCKSFGYTSNVSSGNCTQYGQTLDSQNFVAQAKSPTIFYNYHCFSNPNCLKPTNTAFCSSYLGIQTSTSTTTTTITPTPVTSTTFQSFFSTTTSTSTGTESDIFTSVIFTSTQSTTTYTESTTIFTATSVPCLTAATVLTAYTLPGQDKRDAMANLRRQASTVATPACLKTLPASAISSACKCQVIATPSTTTTASITLTAQTTVETDSTTTTTTASTTISTTTTFSTTVTTSTTTTLALSSTTTTVTYYQPTPSTFPGFNYYQYTNTYNYNQNNPGFNATTFQNNNYGLTGTVQNIGQFITNDYSSSTICTLPGQSTSHDCSQYTVVSQGFFFAATAGTYTFSIPADYVDNGVYVWSGNAAISGYNNGNMDFSATRDGDQNTGGSQTYSLAAGQFLPVTVMWVNGGGPGRAILGITTPTSSLSYNTQGRFFVPGCGVGNPFSP